jgi:hypothetical protein
MRPVAGLAKESQQQYGKNIMLNQLNHEHALLHQCNTWPTKVKDSVSTESLILCIICNTVIQLWVT